MQRVKMKTPGGLAAIPGAKDSEANHCERQYSTVDWQSTENALLRVAYFDTETAMCLAGTVMALADSNQYDAVTYIQAENAALAIIAGSIGGTFDAAQKIERNRLIAELKARFAPRPEGRRRAAA